MTTKRECLSCIFSQWSGNMLACANDESDEYLHYVMPDFMCTGYMRYVGAGDGDESENMGAIE